MLASPGPIALPTASPAAAWSQGCIWRAGALLSFLDLGLPVLVSAQHGSPRANANNADRGAHMLHAALRFYML